MGEAPAREGNSTSDLDGRTENVIPWYVTAIITIAVILILWVLAGYFYFKNRNAASTEEQPQARRAMVPLEPCSMQPGGWITSSAHGPLFYPLQTTCMAT